MNKWIDLPTGVILSGAVFFHAWVQTAGGAQSLLLGHKIEFICTPGYHICTKRPDSLLSALKHLINVL